MKKPNNKLIPGIISSIEQQKNNKNRYSIFVNDQFLIGISESVFLKFGLSKGDELTSELHAEILSAEHRQVIKSYLFKLLSQRAHSRKELLTKATQKEYPEQVTSDILDELEEKNYINDQIFAYKFASDKLVLNRWGPAKIKAALIQKGINSEQIDKGIENAFQEIDIESIFKELIVKKSFRLLEEEDLFKRKKKIFDYLKRKGFRSDQILKHLDQLENSLV